MQINFTGRNLEVTPALKKMTQEKLSKLEHQIDGAKVNVIFKVEHTVHTAEATIHMKGTDINASAEANDMYLAIDKLVDRLKTQILKFKERQTGHRE